MNDDGRRLALGIDVGTQGARVVIIDEIGTVRARAESGWPLQGDASDEREQDPADWLSAIVECVRSASAGVKANRITSISVAATSGTLVLTDANLVPLRPALMWNDKRARREADEANLAFRQHPPCGYVTAFRPTSTLPKALWVRRHESEVWARARHILSAGDWILAQLRGGEPRSDYTNVLKLGYDLETLEWPSVLEDNLGISPSLLPSVVAPGTELGPMTDAAAASFGFSHRPIVIAGMTDANAAQLAGGAVDEGSWLTTIGTGLSVKGVSRARLSSPDGALYSHRHWHEGWVPTATSHSGADSIATEFRGEDLNELTALAHQRELSSTIVLPLATVGEFFPFWAPTATGFVVGEPRDRGDLFRGFLEGIAFVEGLIMQRMVERGAAVIGAQLTMGGGASNTAWMAIRANILGRPVARPKETSSAFGAAIIALAGDPALIAQTADATVRLDLVVEPDSAGVARYAERHGEWLQQLAQRGYLDEPPTTEER